MEDEIEIIDKNQYDCELKSFEFYFLKKSEFRGVFQGKGAI